MINTILELKWKLIKKSGNSKWDLTETYIFNGHRKRMKPSNMIQNDPDENNNHVDDIYEPSNPKHNHLLQRLMFLHLQVTWALLLILNASGSGDKKISNKTIVKYYWDWENDGIDDLVETDPFASHVYNTQGTYTVKLTVEDDGGLKGFYTKFVEVLGSGTPPTVDFTINPEYGVNINTEFTFDASNSTNVKYYRWDWENNGYWNKTTTNPVVTHKYNMPGTYEVKLEVESEGGLKKQLIKSLYILSNDPPTVPIIDFPPNNSTQNVSVIVLKWDCSDPDDDPLVYDIYYQNDNPPLWIIETNHPSESIVVDDLTPGETYWWKIVAKDDNGNVTEGPLWNFTVSESGTAPIAAFVADNTSGTAPLNVNFTDQSTNNPTSWHWEFGDGGTSTQPNPSHSYNTDGSYTVSLTVSNEYGSDIKTKTNYIYVGSGGGGEPCPGTPTVTDLDGNVYNTVQIGGQCWMKENLNVGTRIDGTQEMTSGNGIEKYCYDDEPANCETYGGLYQWDEMMQYTTTQGVQGICPSGWHLPTNDEWTTLTDFLGGTNVAGGKMKETGTTHWNSPNTGATNSSGFTALPGGSRSSNGSFDGLGSYGDWWSSSEDSGTNAWYWTLHHGYYEVYGYYNYKPHGLSVRCLKN